VTALFFLGILGAGLADLADEVDCWAALMVLAALIEAASESISDPLIMGGPMDPQSEPEQLIGGPHSEPEQLMGGGHSEPEQLMGGPLDSQSEPVQSLMGGISEP